MSSVLSGEIAAATAGADYGWFNSGSGKVCVSRDGVIGPGSLLGSFARTGGMLAAVNQPRGSPGIIDESCENRRNKTSSCGTPCIARDPATTSTSNLCPQPSPSHTSYSAHRWSPRQTTADWNPDLRPCVNGCKALYLYRSTEEHKARKVGVLKRYTARREYRQARRVRSVACDR